MEMLIKLKLSKIIPMLKIKLASMKVRLRFFSKYFSMDRSAIEIVKVSSLPASPKLHFLAAIKPSHKKMVIESIQKSNSQLFQDVFVSNELKFLENGFYVEFGALDGLRDSNTLFLERNFNWHGILVEPSRKNYSRLCQTRSQNTLDNRAVHSTSDQELLFNETFTLGLSTLDSFSNSDGWDRKSEEKYLVKTVTLVDLLLQNNSPKRINYLSIDTEGSEFEILKNFDFDLFSIDIITVEHNFTESRENIHKLLDMKGFKRKYENVSSFDDWYVNKRVLT
jgi:FkbM family methyltransferase